jgi:hypothetical protein
MRKTLTLFASVILSLSVTVALADKGPATATIDAAAKKQAPVVFPHEKHTTLVKTCDTCHHTNKGLKADAKVKVEKCSACHLKAQGKVTAMSDMSLQKNPMHLRCVGCHKELKKGPVACTACHKKK